MTEWRLPQFYFSTVQIQLERFQKEVQFKLISDLGPNPVQDSNLGHGMGDLI